MKTFAIAALVVLGLASCTTIHNTTEEKQWAALEGKSVFVMAGYDKVVHDNPACPALANARGTVTSCRVRDGRLVNDAGIFLNSPNERLPLCGSCVK